MDVFVGEADVGDPCHFRVGSGTMLIACAADPHHAPAPRHIRHQPALRSGFDLERVGLPGRLGAERPADGRIYADSIFCYRS